MYKHIINIYLQSIFYTKLHSLSQNMEQQQKRAFITGITGQDGSYLAELLIEKGYEVHGMIRRSSSFNTGRIEHLYKDYKDKKLHLHYGDLSDATNLIHIISKIKPHEVYNLGAMSHVAVSFEMPEYTADIDATGTLRLLDAIRTCGLTHFTKFYQASTSELYGKVREIPQTELTPFYPRSPYGVAKQYAYWIVVNYREAYGMHASNGILFNHESPRRGPTFVTRKITRAIANIHLGSQEPIYLGNLDAKRDWGHAKDYVEGMWRMLQQPDHGDDYVLATNETHSVREFVELAFSCIDIKIKWIRCDNSVSDGGSSVVVDEIGVDEADTSRVLVRIDPKYFRPTEVDILIGDATKARTQLGWVPRTSFVELVEEMVAADIADAMRRQ